MSQGRYVWIAGKKVYLNPEQADYRRCNGDCFVCPWRKEGIVVSYETEHFAEGSAMTMQRAAMAL